MPENDFAENFGLHFENNHLVVKQLWDGLEFRVIPGSELHFFCKLNPFTVSFIKDSRGHIKQALVMNSDLWTKVEK